VIGKPAKNAAKILSWKCMCGMASMNTILKNCQTRLHLNQHIAQNAEKELFCPMAGIRRFAKYIVVIIVRLRKKNGRK